MVSQYTLEQIAMVLKRNLVKAQREIIIEELKSIRGNKSFRDTVQALALLFGEP